MHDAGTDRIVSNKAKPMSVRYRIVRKIGYWFRLTLEAKPLAKPGFIWRLAMRILAGLMRMHGWTLRYQVEDKPGYFTNEVERPVIFLLWHNRIVAMPVFYARWRRRYRLRACVLTSASREGSLLALFLSHFGLGAIRGSTSRRASIALREMIDGIAEGDDMIITPDGPRGPRYRLQAGALYLAQRTGRPLVPLQVEYGRYVRFKSWDGFAVPLPFSKVNVTIGDPMWVDPSLTDERFEAERVKVQQEMTGSLVMDGVASSDQNQ